MSNYDKMSTEDFDRLLADVMDDDNAKASSLLAVPGIYEVVSEHYNNAVLAAWDAEQAGDDWVEERTKGDDDGQEYGDPRDYREGKE